MEAKGFNVDRKRITIDQDPVKEVGSYKATIRLHKDVSVVIDFDVVSE